MTDPAVTGPSRRRRLLILVICCMSLVIVGLDNTIVNVALPSIQRDLHASVSGLQWVVDALHAGAGQPPGALRAPPRTGSGGASRSRPAWPRSRSASLLCSLAPSLGWLVAFRMLQAVGGSMLNPVAMSIIVNTFTDRAERARAIGVWGAAVGVSLALGPVVGGLLIASVGWRGIFWVNIPVGVAAIVLTALFVPESKAPHPRRLDPVGQVLVIVTLASLIYGIIEGPSHGWGSPEIIACFCLFAVALATLLVYEPRRREPLLDFRFFRSAPFSGATVIAVSAFAALGGFLFLNTLYLQDVRGYSALHAGLLTLPLAAVTVVFAPLSGRMISIRGPRIPLIVAGVCMSGGALMLTGLTAQQSTGWLLASYVLFGIGFGVVNAPITNTAVSGMPRAQAGVASAIASTSRQVGQSLGVAVVGSAVTSVMVGPMRTGFTAASHVGWWIITGCGLVVLVVGLVTSGRWARRTAARTADRLMSEEEEPVPVG